MKELLSKIQELPDYKRKMIFWVIMVILALTLSGFYIKYTQKKVAGISIEKTKEEMQVHSLEEIIDKVKEIEIPKIEIPEISQEALQELEITMEEAAREIPEEMPTENNHNQITE